MFSYDWLNVEVGFEIASQIKKTGMAHLQYFIKICY